MEVTVPAGGVAWVIAGETSHVAADAGIPWEGQWAAPGQKAGSVPGPSAPFLIRPNELPCNSAKKVLLPSLPSLWLLGGV